MLPFRRNMFRVRSTGSVQPRLVIAPRIEFRIIRTRHSRTRENSWHCRTPSRPVGVQVVAPKVLSKTHGFCDLTGRPLGVYVPRALLDYSASSDLSLVDDSDSEGGGCQQGMELQRVVCHFLSCDVLGCPPSSSAGGCESPRQMLARHHLEPGA